MVRGAIALDTAMKPDWLAKYRENNQQVFEAKPVKKSKYSSITQLESLLTKPVKGAAIPRIDMQGVEVMGLNDAVEKMPAQIAQILSKEEVAADQFEAYVNSNFNSGHVIIVGRKAHKKKIAMETKLEEGALQKSIIIIEEGVECCIVNKMHGSGTVLHSQTIYLKEGANATICTIHSESGSLIASQQCIVEGRGKLTNNNCWFGPKTARARVANILNGDGASEREYSLLYSGETQHFDINSSSVHRQRATESHCIFKSVLDGESRNVFDAMIRIEEGATGANALLECHSMILGEKASSNQIPSLEIKTDDVKATHSATVAHIDDDELFYLCSRGIKKESAREMVAKGFLQSVSYMLPQAVRGEIGGEIEKAL